MWYGATNPTQYPAMVLQARLTKTVNARVPLARGHGLDRRLRQERKPCSYLRRNPQEVISQANFERACAASAIAIDWVVSRSPTGQFLPTVAQCTVRPQQAQEYPIRRAVLT